MNITIFSTHTFDKPFLEIAAGNEHKCTFLEEKLSEETLHLAKNADVVALFTSDNASETVLKALFKIGVRFIALRSVGYDHVNLKIAQKLGFRVANVPAYSPYAVAEHAVMLLLAVNRKIIYSQMLLNANNFLLDNLTGIDIHGKTVGIIGTGKIGAAFASIMHGFGCKLLAYDIKEDENLIKNTQISYVDMETLCKKADIISIHCPLNEETRYLMDEKHFELMKKGVILINTARGGIINTLDLIIALNNGTVGAAGLDVYEHEKALFFSNQSQQLPKDALFATLRSYPNVLVTAHQSFLTKEALTGIAKTTFSNINAWEKTGKSENDLF